MKRSHLFVSLLAALLLCLSLGVASGEDVDSLTLTGDEVQSLEGVSAYPALKSLTLIDCPAFDLTPLADCGKLSSLALLWSDDYTGEGVYDLTPLQKCTRLNTLSLGGKGITDLSILPKLKKLKTLSLASIAATDYSPLEALSLKHLSLYGADADSVTAVFSAIGRGLTSAAIGGCTLTADASDAILSCTRLVSLRFTDAENIDGQSARWAKLKILTSLTITGGSVSSLSFTDSYVSTVGVKLTDVFVGGAIGSLDFDKYFLHTTDVPEAELLNLLQGEDRSWQYVTIRNQNALYSPTVIQAIGTISGLISLDIQALATDAFGSEIWDGFQILEQLKLSDCPAISLPMLQRTPSLKRLFIQNASISASEQVATLSKLEQLSLLRCTVDDWAYLSSLPTARMTHISLARCNGPETLAFVKDLAKLKVLVLEDAPITDITPLSGVNLETLSLYGCTISDYSGLQTLASLKRLYCNVDAELPALSSRVIRRPVTPAE